MPQYVLGYVYQLNDFDTTGSNITPPNEQGARAQGTPPFDITLSSGAVPLRLVIDDDDALFHETRSSDPLQELVDPVTIDGVLYPAGSHVVINYVLTDANGFEGFSITIGQNNSGSNTTTAFITNQPMVPGQTYTFISEGNIGNNNPEPYAQFACFTAGTLIETSQGPKAIETLQPGDLLLTLDNGPQPVRSVLSRTVRGRGDMAPVTLRAGAFGNEADIMVSPNHRVLVEGAMAELVAGCDSLLVAAKHLVNGTSVLQRPCSLVTYVHIVLDRHEIVTTQGCRSESFFVAEGFDDVLNADQVEELLTLFPELTVGPAAQLAHPEAKRFEADLIARTVAA